MHLPEIREADASPEILAIFNDIKAVSHVPQVNLIWRHFATEPDILAWSWAALRPAFTSGQIGETAARLFTKVPGDGQASLTDALAPALAREVSAILAYYNHGNPQNLLAFMTLTRLGGGSGTPTRETDAAPPDAADVSNVSSATRGPGAIPALPARSSLSDDVCGRIDTMANRHGGAALGVTPSMYLHLGLYPDALNAADKRISGLLARADFKDKVAHLISDAEAEAGRIASALAEMSQSAALPPRPDPARLDPMLKTASNFVATTIPEMIVVGAALAGARDA